MNLRDLLDAGTAFLGSWIGVHYVGRLALRHRILDVPNERSSHSEPVPRGGGIAIVVTVLLGMVAWTVATGGASRRVVIAWIAGSILIAMVSAIDDLRSLPTLLRLLAHTIAAAGVIAIAGPLVAIGQSDVALLHFAKGGTVLTLVWIVGLTNAFNFMDGIDGIAGGQAVVAASALAIAAARMHEPAVEMLGILIAAASAGFLLHNWSPAKIFMGDVGSAFLGYSLAAAALMGEQSRPELLMIAVASMWPFLFDSIFTFTRRLLKREEVWKAHRSHLYQRLVTTGLTHAQVSLLYIAMSSVAAALALLGMRYAELTIAAGVSVICMAAILWLFVRMRESVTASRLPSSGGS